MSVIHRTTLKPTKTDLLTDWLPGRSWYRGGAGAPVLDRAGGFRLDDPEGEVGIEFLVAVDTSGPAPVHYHVPLTYRAALLEGAEHALVGTTEHGVLGTRWVYDGAHDPVLTAQLYALLRGEAEAQHQRISHTPDPEVAVHRSASALPVASFGPGTTDAADGPGATEVRVPAQGEDLVLRIVRTARPDGDTDEAGERGRVTGHWTAPDGGTARGVLARLAPRRLPA